MSQSPIHKSKVHKTKVHGTKAGFICPSRLSALLAHEPLALECLATLGVDPEISGLALDSRQVKPGWLFVALSGYADQAQHGLNYVDKAIAQGAAAVVWEPPGDVAQIEDRGVPVIAVPLLCNKLLAMAKLLYVWSSEQPSIVGITGTDGKTSCSHYLAQSLSAPYQVGGDPADGASKGAKCGVIGTVGWGLYGDLHSATHTTPDVLSVYRLIAEQAEAGAHYVSMEVSSHALDQGRVDGIEFTVAMLTNLQRDHLDYHQTLDNYAEAKTKLFTSKGLCHAVLNADDEFSMHLRKRINSDVSCVWYGLKQPAQLPEGDRYVYARTIHSDQKGQRVEVHSSWSEGVLATTLLGRFNVANLLGVLSVLLSLGLRLDEALARLRKVKNAPGRMQRIGGGLRPLVVVDYAHTPAALEHALMSLREHLAAQGRLICVFGCGGDRDRGKRPLMAAAAERLADAVFVTNDNPRTESPSMIFDDILAGMTNPQACELQEDRALAIDHAIGMATVDDIVLLAGKGHENYQLFGARRLHFDDREQATIALNTWWDRLHGVNHHDDTEEGRTDA